jgi:hypothetical protein
MVRGSIKLIQNCCEKVEFYCHIRKQSTQGVNDEQRYTLLLSFSAGYVQQRNPERQGNQEERIQHTREGTAKDCAPSMFVHHQQARRARRR